jgi:hypothetical protein
MVLPIKFCLELEYCVAIMSFDGSMFYPIVTMVTTIGSLLQIYYYIYDDYVSRILNILYRHLKIINLQITILTQLYVRVCNLLKYEKHRHDYIIALKGEVSTHNINLMHPHFIEVAAPSREILMCIRGIDFASIFTFQ